MRPLGVGAGPPPRPNEITKKSRFSGATTGLQRVRGGDVDDLQSTKTPANGALWCLVVSAP